MQKATPPRRRWYQFSLRTLFGVLTVVALATPSTARRYRQWQAAREAAAAAAEAARDKSAL